MLKRAIATLLERYFFDDGMIARVGIFNVRGEVEIFASTPILPAHPDYSRARMNMSYKRGRVYSAEDWRNLRLLLAGVEDCEGRLGSEPLSDGHSYEMSYEFEIDSFSMKPLTPSVASLILTAENLSLRCRFQSLEFSDSLISMP